MNRTTGMARFAPSAAAAASFGAGAARRMPEAPAGLPCGNLLGNVAAADHTGADGWTLDEAHPGAPVAVATPEGAAASAAPPKPSKLAAAAAGVGAKRVARFMPSY